MRRKRNIIIFTIAGTVFLAAGAILYWRIRKTKKDTRALMRAEKYLKEPELEKDDMEELKRYDIPAVEWDMPASERANIIAAGINDVKKKYGTEIAQWVERIMRLETAHFKSGGFKKTLQGGMHPSSNVLTRYRYPYGWKERIWKDSDMRPIGVTKIREGGTGKMRTYLVFRGTSGFMYLASYIKDYDNPARWYSTNPESQKRYLASLEKIDTQYA